MSSRTPTECVDLATDPSANSADRIDAIHALKRANECDELAALVVMETLDESLRREALDTLATPQCDSTLENLVEDGELNAELHERASDLLTGLDSD